MNKAIDLDIIIILSLPLILGICLYFLPDKSWFYCISVILSILFYELFIFPNRQVYGFSGLNIITIPSLIILSYTIIIALPSIYVCYEKNTPAVYPYFFSVIGFYFLFPLGLLLGNKIWKIDIEKVKIIRFSELRKDKIDPIAGELLYFILLVGLSIYALYLARVKTIPIIELISDPGSSAKFALLREEAFKILKITTVEKYLILWQRALIFPGGILLSLFLYLIYKKRKYLILLIVFFITGLTFNSLTLEKAPMGAIFLIIMSFFYIKKNKVSLKFVIISIFLFFALPITIIYLMYVAEHKEIAAYIIKFLIKRIFIVPTEVLYYHFEIFPGRVDFLLGRSSQLFSWMYSDGGIFLPTRVAQYIYRSPQTLVYSNAIFLGNFWADFGAPGIILSTFGIGLIVHWIYWKLLTTVNYKKNIIFMLFSSISVPIFSFQFLSTNFTILFFSNGFVVLIIFLLVISRYVNPMLNGNRNKT